MSNVGKKLVTKYSERRPCSTPSCGKLTVNKSGVCRDCLSGRIILRRVGTMKL